MIDTWTLSRRELMKSLTTMAAMFGLPNTTLYAMTGEKIVRSIPGTDETLSVIGVGSWQTLDVSVSTLADTELVNVMQAFFDNGGELVDTSPMYGNSETVIGELIKHVEGIENYFAATKVWTRGRDKGINQMNSSMRKMNVKVMDLMQIHNLLDWKVHLKTLNQWKEEGKIRYTGITTSGGRNHDELVEILKNNDLDFVQCSYNILDRKAEKNIFPIVRDKAMGVLINVPFRRGRLFKAVSGKPVPTWAAEFDCESWGQFFLKFIASHPDVTNIIPATTKVKHMIDNMAAGFGRLPDPDTRQRMIKTMESI